MKKIIKWKCTVCNGINQAFIRPRLCPECGVQGYKLKALTYKLKQQSYAEEPEASH